jgi:hypothetical protein
MFGGNIIQLTEIMKFMFPEKSMILGIILEKEINKVAE